MKALVIIQPDAEGSATREAVVDAIERHFTAARLAFEVLETVKDGEPGDIVRARLGEGFDLVVVAGGDGTVSGVFDGLQGSPLPLGIIPTGTGNLIAREFDIPTGIDEAVALIAGTPRWLKIDAMRIGGRVYVLNAGVGINAAVIANTTGRSKRRFGRVAYFVTALRLHRFRPRHLEVTVDGTRHTCRAVEVAISNCGMLARVLYPKGPDIRADDGQLDVWIISLETILDYVRYLFGIALGRRAHARLLIARKSIVITSRVPLTVQADGDVIGTTPLAVEVLPGVLAVLVPGPSAPGSPRMIATTEGGRACPIE